MGSWKGVKPTGSLEEILKADPDLVINMGDVGKENASDADVIQERLGIPVVMVDGSIGKTAESYLFLGDMLGRGDRARKLAAYAAETLERVNAHVEKIPESERVSVYYAEGPKGLETDTPGTINTEILEIAGAVNVADPEANRARRIQVSLEQVLDWNPDVIIISSDGDRTHRLYHSVFSESGWANLKAVRNDRVYEIPVAPYDWINRPPSVNRLIGMKWLVWLLYPDESDINIVQEAQEFMRLFYQCEISAEQARELLKYAGGE